MDKVKAMACIYAGAGLMRMWNLVVWSILLFIRYFSFMLVQVRTPALRIVCSNPGS